MTPLPGALGTSEIVAWRLDVERYAPTWDSGEGAYQLGGRWNSRGVRTVYAALDPSTAILEVAVHKGFRTLDAVPHVLTAVTIARDASVFIVRPEDAPVRDWFDPGIPGADQQRFGDRLLALHEFVLLPSVVSRKSWNIIFDPLRATSRYRRRSQESFVLDPRLKSSEP